MSDDQIPEPLAEIEGLRDVQPPGGMEQRLLGRLRSEGLLVAGSRRRTATLALLAAAATLAAFFFGVQYAHRPAAPPAAGSERYMLLLLEPAAAPIGVGDRALEAEYSVWARGLARAGRLQTGEKLSLRGQRLSPDGSVQPMDPVAPFAGEIVTGFFIVNVADQGEAMALARECPHLRYGGRVEVRRIEGT